MPFVVRRAEPGDAPAIHRLLVESNSTSTDWTIAVERRFGKHAASVKGIAKMIDRCSFTAVAASADDLVVFGFMAVSEGIVAGASSGAGQSGDWLDWLQERFECPAGLKHDSAMFLRMFIADPMVSLAFTYDALTALFTSVPRLEYVGYLLPHGLAVFPPFNGPRYLAPGEKLAGDTIAQSSTLHQQPDQLHLVQQGFFKDVPSLGEYKQHELKLLHRHLITTKLAIRKARVEDCDDLVPMFKRHQMLPADASDYHIAQLIESTDERTKTLVAEVAGKVVGFMSLSTRVDYAVLADCYHLDAYETLLVNGEKTKPAGATRHNHHGGARKTPDFFASVSMGKSLDKLSGGSRAQLGSHHSLLTSKNRLDANDETEETIQAKRESNERVGKLTTGMSTSNLGRSLSQELAAEVQPNIEEADRTLGTMKHDDTHHKSVFELVLEDTIKADIVREDHKTVNAFCVTLFCIEDRYAGMASEFLTAAFACLPALDYALLTLPTDAAEIPLLSSFTRVSHKWDWSPPHCLYLSYRYSVDATVTVRKGKLEDAAKIYEIIQDLPNESDLITSLKKSRLGSKNSDASSVGAAEKHPACMVAEAYDQIVGVIIADHCDADPFVEQYDVENFITREMHKLDGSVHTRLRSFVLNPLFVPQSKAILGEVCRLLGSTVLFYPMEGSTRHDVVTRQLVLKDFVPVKRRRRTDYPGGLNDGVTPHATLPYALRLFTTNLLHEPRLTYNVKIVIVGASDTGMAVAERLIYTPHLNFTNITVVSLDGLPQLDVHNAAATSMFADAMCYDADELKQIGLENYVNDIPGRVTMIDRDLKHLILSDDSVIPFDYLILAPGLQYQPEHIGSELRRLENVVGINRFAASDIHDAVKNCAHSQFWPDAGETVAVVYGNDVQSYAAVQGLIAEGVQANKIAFVQPPRAGGDGTSVFQNRAVDEKMVVELKKAGVHLHHGTIVKWTKADDDNSIRSVTVKVSDSQKLELSCHLFLYSHLRTVNASIFRAINDSCLVFDERLVIDGRFRTHDAAIFAAGPVTKYSIRYKTRWSHNDYDSREVGDALARQLLAVFDPLNEDHGSVRGHSAPLPEFMACKKLAARLVGGFFYFHYDRPHLEGECRFDVSPKDGAQIVQTRTDAGGVAETDLRLFVDGHGFVTALSYLGKRHVSTGNLICLYRIHELVLNRLLSRFQEGIIPDLTAYFEETWVLPVYHDRFPAFMERQRRLMIEAALHHTGQYTDTKKLLEQLRDYATKNPHSLSMPEEERRNLYTAFDQSPDRKMMDESLRSYLVDVVPQE